MVNVIVSIFLSVFFCIIVAIVDNNFTIHSDINLLNKLENYIPRNSTSYIIAFLILGVINGSLSAFIISRYKSFNLVASMILPILITIGYLYISFLLPIQLYLSNVGGAIGSIDWGLTQFLLISITTLFLFLRDQSN